MKLVIKVGGTLLREQDARALDPFLLALETGSLVGAGHQVLVVHGGGAQVTAFLEARGIAPQFIEGRRVTTPETLEAAIQVMAGTVNHRLLAAFAAAGVRACGISGVDGACLYAERASNGLGLVGRVERVNPLLFEALCARGFVPVMASLAVGPGGQILNVNADEVAVACAAAWLADRLLFLSDVEGVLGADGGVLRRLTPEEARALVAAGVATGGMLAKLRAASAAVARGVPAVRIVPGHHPRVLHRVLAGEECGTEIVASPQPPPALSGVEGTPIPHL